MFLSEQSRQQPKKLRMTRIFHTVRPRGSRHKDSLHFPCGCGPNSWTLGRAPSRQRPPDSSQNTGSEFFPNREQARFKLSFGSPFEGSYRAIAKKSGLVAHAIQASTAKWLLRWQRWRRHQSPCRREHCGSSRPRKPCGMSRVWASRLRGFGLMES